LRRARKISVVILAVLLLADAAVLIFRWPYAKHRVVEGLERGTASKLNFSSSRYTWLPRPGCIFERAVIARGSVPLATIRTLSVQGSWADVLLFRRRTHGIRVEGLQVRLPREIPGSVRHDKKQSAETVIGEIVADGATLEMVRQSRTFRFEFPRLALRDVARSQRIGFRVTARIPEPPGTLTASGNLGPWNSVSARLTELSGAFDLKDADLSRYETIAGLLAAKGSFAGNLGRLEVRGDVDTPNFQITQSPNATQLRAKYHVIVDALSGETTIENVDAAFARTKIQAHGSITREPGTNVLVEFAAKEARIEDLLRMFSRSPNPALEGPITFRARAALPPGEERFLRKLRLDGGFGIDDAEFGRGRTQRKVNELSARARGHGKEVADGMKPASVVSDLKGRVAMRDGVAHLSALSFRVPGAAAEGSGTYSLLSKQVDLRGMLTMEADLPETTSGIKSILLKPFSWIFDRKKGKGSRVPVRVTGVYPNAKFQISLTGRK
jgi:hypothetical protein